MRLQRESIGLRRARSSKLEESGVFGCCSLAEARSHSLEQRSLRGILSWALTGDGARSCNPRLVEEEAFRYGCYGFPVHLHFFFIFLMTHSLWFPLCLLGCIGLIFRELATFYALFWQIFFILTHWLLDPWIKWGNGLNIFVKCFMFYSRFCFLLLCFLLNARARL